MAEPDKRPRFGQEVLNFTKDVFSYLFWRIRQLAVLFWVAGDLAVKFADGVKKILMRYVFWGRGNWYRLGVLSAIGVAILMLPFTLYRDPITKAIYAEEAPVLDVSENDLLVERGSSQTLIPKGRAKMKIETYTVKPGDTISTIAESNNLTTQTLLWANDMTENDFIKPGQELIIPPKNGVVHTVVEGDTLSSLAEEYNAADQAIVDANWLEPPDFALTIGKTLVIPEGTMPPPPAPPTPVVAATPTPTPTYGGYVPPVTPVTVPSAGRFLGWPVAGGAGVVSQCPSGWHMAIDIADSSYPPLVAAAAGTVVFAGMNDPWGFAWSVQIDHGNGFTTFYAHMSSIGVASGQYVGKGQVIGTMGATGLATGVHVHFELRMGSSWAATVNPSPYMERSVCGY